MSMTQWQAHDKDCIEQINERWKEKRAVFSADIQEDEVGFELV
jgi:hypothetical protein